MLICCWWSGSEAGFTKVVWDVKRAGSVFFSERFDSNPVNLKSDPSLACVTERKEKFISPVFRVGGTIFFSLYLHQSRFWKFLFSSGYLPSFWHIHALEFRVWSLWQLFFQLDAKKNWDLFYKRYRMFIKYCVFVLEFSQVCHLSLASTRLLLVVQKITSQ